MLDAAHVSDIPIYRSPPVRSRPASAARQYTNSHMCANQTKISWFDSDASCAALVELALLVSVVGWLFDWFEFAPRWFEFAPAPAPQASGLRYFDAARSYGESEEFLVCNVLYCTVRYCNVM